MLHIAACSTKLQQLNTHTNFAAGSVSCSISIDAELHTLVYVLTRHFTDWHIQSDLA